MSLPLVAFSILVFCIGYFVGAFDKSPTGKSH